jgi:biopolymer transport protein ExbD
MKKNTFLIRFIDIGLILLFGFVIISDITIRSQIEMPGSDPTISQEVIQHTLLIIEILPGNEFRVTEAETEISHGVLTGLDQLASVLMGLNRHFVEIGKAAVAVIEPDDNISMQSLVDVLDTCDRLGIPKNINVPALRL